MNKVRKIAFILIGAVIAVFLVALIGHNFIIKSSVGPAVKTITGFDASVGDVNVSLFSSKLDIKELKVMNPDDFTEKRMLDAPVIYVEYKLLSMLSKRREFPVIRIHIAEVVVVKNVKGESNVKRIMDAKPKSEASGPSAENVFGTLDLTLGKVIYVDYSKLVNGKPITKETTLNFHGVYHNLSDADLKNVVMLETLRTLPGKLADITPDTIKKQLGDVTGVGLGVATNVTSAAVDAVKGLGGLFHSKKDSSAN